MMLSTHILVGILLGATFSVITPIAPFPLVTAGAVGGLFPDIDMLWTHRKTLHYPVSYSVLSSILASLYLFTGIEIILILGITTSAAALHSLMDIFGGGKEMRPWRETDDRAVFNHYSGEWITPLRIFYDGSFPDFLLAISSGIVAIWILPGTFLVPITILALFSLMYMLFRQTITRHIPEQYPTFSSYIQDKLK